jgi:hypothetical protein
MPTPSIQTLVTDAQQILNLDSISAVRSVVAVALANANTGTPLNPNLTTQQLWNEFYQVVNKPKSDIESIIANQLMKLLYAPPAPGGAGADKQVIFNDGGVLAGDAGFTYNKATDALTLLGDLTSGGDAYLNGNEKYVYLFSNYSIGNNSRVRFRAVGAGGGSGYGGDFRISTRATNNTWNTDVLTIDSSANCIWTDGAGGTRMTLNSTGLGVGAVPTFEKLVLQSAADCYVSLKKTGGLDAFNLATDGTTGWLASSAGTTGKKIGINLKCPDNTLAIDISGNVGVGVTPSAWATYKAVQSGYASLAGYAGTDTLLGANVYFDGNFKYIASSTASGYRQSGGTHLWYIGASGTAGNTISGFSAASMTLDASGRLLVGTTSAFTDLTGSKEVRVGDGGMQTLTIASFPATTATNVARGGLGGLVYVGAYNGTGQYGAIVLWTASSATVVSVINGTGSTITFGVSGGFLQMTSSLALTQVSTNSLRI